MKSLFTLPTPPHAPDGGELFEPLLTGPGGLLVERIISHGQTTPEGQWLDQEKDEWVSVIEGSAVILWENGERSSLARGEHLFIPRRKKHRVAYASSPCIWIAVHGFDLHRPK